MLLREPAGEETLGFTPEEWIADPLAWCTPVPSRRPRARARRSTSGSSARASRSRPSTGCSPATVRCGGSATRPSSCATARASPLYWQGVDVRHHREAGSGQRARGGVRGAVSALRRAASPRSCTGKRCRGDDAPDRLHQPPGRGAARDLAGGMGRRPRRVDAEIHPDDRARGRRRRTARPSAPVEPFAVEYRMLARDGRIVWFRDEAQLVRDEPADPSLAGRDDGHHRSQGRRGADSPRRRRATGPSSSSFRRSPTSTRSTGTGRSTSARRPRRSSATRRRSGTPTPNLWRSIVHPDDRVRGSRRKTSEPYSSTYRMIARDGHEVWMHDQARTRVRRRGRARLLAGPAARRDASSAGPSSSSANSTSSGVDRRAPPRRRRDEDDVPAGGRRTTCGRRSPRSSASPSRWSATT